jgi:hypothetical protein
MKRETPEEKYERIRTHVQGAILREYPNPDRAGCPGTECLAEIAARIADFDGAIEEDSRWQHITHCSPCYGEYLNELEKVRVSKRASAKIAYLLPTRPE